VEQERYKWIDGERLFYGNNATFYPKTQSLWMKYCLNVYQYSRLLYCIKPKWVARSKL